MTGRRLLLIAAGLGLAVVAVVAVRRRRYTGEGAELQHWYEEHPDHLVAWFEPDYGPEL